MNNFLLISSIIFSIHTVETNNQSSSEEIPTINKTVEAAKKRIEEAVNNGTISNVYIVTLKEGVNLNSVIQEMQKETGGKLIHSYPSIPGFAIELPKEYSPSDLFFHNSVIDVEKDLILKPLEIEVETQATSQSERAETTSSQHLPNGIKRVNAHLSQTAKINGVDDPFNVNIAIIDTGVSNHSDLNVVHTQSFISGVQSGNDDNGHGTHIAGTAAAKDNGIGVVGVAPGARIYGLKVLNNEAWGYLSDIISAVDWVTEQSKTEPLVSNSSAKRNYDRYMSRYESYMKRSVSYLDRATQYQERANEYKVEAEKNKWVPDPNSQRNYDSYMRSYDSYMRRYNSYMQRAASYQSRVDQYKQRAEEYKQQAEEYLANGDTRNYDRYMSRYASYIKRAESYVDRVNQYQERAEDYKKQALEYKVLAEQSKDSSKLVLSRTYEQNIRRYESYMKRAESYLARANEYEKQAEDYKRQAEEYLANSGQEGVRNPNKIDVVNMSIGANGVNRSLQRAIQASIDRGVIYVVSAGNGGSDIFGPDGKIYTDDDIIPAAYPEVVTVSSMADSDGRNGGLGGFATFNTPDDTMPPFSNHSGHLDSASLVTSPGRGIDVAAPGIDVFSTSLNGSYLIRHGTSMSAPHVAGAFALLIAKMGQDVNVDGRIDENDVLIFRQLLLETAEPQSAWGPSKTNDRDAYQEGVLQVTSF